MECEYCKNKLTTKKALLNHQTNTKYCLEIQEKIKPLKHIICEEKEHQINKLSEDFSIQNFRDGINLKMFEDIPILESQFPFLSPKTFLCLKIVLDHLEEEKIEF